MMLSGNGGTGIEIQHEQSRARWAMVLTCFSLVWLTACGNLPNRTAPTTESIVTLTDVPTLAVPTATFVPTATPAASATPNDQIDLSVWWPEPLAPMNNDDASLLLTDQINNFESANPNVRIEIRLKQVEDVGGILSTLRSASLVAPGDLPDLTLLDRDNLLEAAQASLLQPFNGASLQVIRNDLYPAALELGIVNRQFDGLPYALSIEHMVYRPLIMSGSFTHFDDVLHENQKFVFPAGNTRDPDDMVLLQYLSAGGTLAQINAAKLDESVLQTVFKFYSDAVAKGLIDPAVLNYTQTDDYQSALISGQINAGLVTSSEYLNLLKLGQAMEAAPIPLASGDPTTTVDGWMWVMVTKDASRQAAALSFMTWMLDAGRQAAYTESVQVLPSRRTAMQQWNTGDYEPFANRLLLNAHIPIELEANGAVLQAMQSALATIISGQRTADEAVQDVLSQLKK